MDTVTQSWGPALLSTSVIIAVIAWLANRFISSFDQRLADAEAEAKEIKQNYNRKFEQVNEKIDDRCDDLKDHFTNEIKEMKREEAKRSVEQARSEATLGAKLDQLIHNVNNNRI